MQIIVILKSFRHFSFTFKCCPSNFAPSTGRHNISSKYGCPEIIIEINKNE